MPLETIAELLIVLGIAFIAGAVNAVAGGGTNLSFPTLLWLGLPPVQANTTNAVGLWPGAAGGAWGYRTVIRGSDRDWLFLAVPSLLGGVLGGWLLVHTPSGLFRDIAPWLVIGSTILIGLDPLIRRHLDWGGEQGRSRAWRVAAVSAQFVISVYGGYFGAGMGILLLTTLTMLGLHDIHRANALKNLFTIAIKGVAVGYFIATGNLIWSVAIAMAVASTAGGWAGAHLGLRVPTATMRWVVVALGFAMGAAMLVRV